MEVTPESLSSNYSKGHMQTKIISIKQKAHAFTVAAVCGLVLAVPAALGLAGGKAEVRDVSLAALAVEVLLITAAVFFWCRETPQTVSREMKE